MTPVRDRSLHAVLWFGQLVMAAVFGFAGYEKLTRPIAALAGPMPWVIDVPPMLVTFIGACETAGAIGLVLPSLTGGSIASGQYDVLGRRFYIGARARF